MTHKLILGGTGTGKTEKVLQSINEGTLCVDPHDSLARGTAARHVGSKRPFVLDRLKETEQVLPIEFLRPSAKSGLQAELENEAQVKGFMEVLSRTRGLTSLFDKPLTYEWLLATFEMWLSQSDPKPPLHLIHELFDIHSESRDLLIINSTDTRLRRKFAELKKMPPVARRNEVGAAERLLNSVLRSPVLKARMGRGFDFVHHLNNGGVIALQGAGVSEDQKRVMLGSWCQAVINAARRGEFTRPVNLIIDEAPVVVTQAECNALAELRKSNLRITLICQSLTFESEMVETIVQNSDTLEIFRCGSSRTASDLAQIIGTYSLDSDSVAHRRQAQRQFHDGYDDARRAQYRIEDEEVIQWRSFTEQIKQWEQLILKLKVGECIVKDALGVRKIRVRLKRRKYPWPCLLESRTERFIQESIQRYGTKPSENSWTFTPALSVSSNKCSTNESVSVPTSQSQNAFRVSRNARTASTSGVSTSTLEGDRQTFGDGTSSNATP